MPTPDALTRTVPVELTAHELTLIRVSCLMRLSRLKKVIDDVKPADKVEQSAYDGAQQSYDELRELMNGKLWDARKAHTALTKGDGQ